MVARRLTFRKVHPILKGLQGVTQFWREKSVPLPGLPQSLRDNPE